MKKIIDTHIHVWNLERLRYSWLDGNTSILNKTYLLSELENSRKAAGITGGILVQAANTVEETEYMLELAAANPWINGVVGWLPLQDPEKIVFLLQNKFAGNPYLKGIRHLIHDEVDARWLLQPAVIESLQILATHGLVYDVVGIKNEHIETALQVAEKVPDLVMVFDHLNQPPIAAGERFGRWGELMKVAAAHPRFHAKISGMGTTSQDAFKWTGETVKPYVDFMLEHFGTARCCAGGDWPVSLLAGSYEYTWKNYLEVFTALLSEADQQKVLSENAVGIYHL